MATHSGVLAWEIPQTERSLADYSPWGHKESDTTEHTQAHQRIMCVKACPPSNPLSFPVPPDADMARILDLLGDFTTLQSGL